MVLKCMKQLGLIWLGRNLTLGMVLRLQHVHDALKQTTGISLSLYLSGAKSTVDLGKMSQALN